MRNFFNKDEHNAQYELRKQERLESIWGKNNQMDFERLLTGIKGFDEMTDGGVPKGRAMLISGGTGCGKTIFLNEFLYRGITKYDQNGVFITFEERPNDIKKNVVNFGWDFHELEAQNKLAFVDASPDSLSLIEGGEYNWLQALKTRIDFALSKTNAQRVAIDSVGSVFGRYDTFDKKSKIRDGIFLLLDLLKEKGLTVFVSAEKEQASQEISRFGIEEFVSDGIINLNTIIGQNQITRTIIIRKIRGMGFRSGHVEFDITKDGVMIYPKIPIESNVALTDFDNRKSTGIAKLDAVIEGGIPQGHMMLIGGNTGTGKTIMGMHFLVQGIAQGEKCVWVALEEPIPQVKKLAASFGWDFETYEQEGKLKFVYAKLLDLSPDKLLYGVIDAVEELGATRVVIDSVSSLESASMNRDKVREFLMQATYYFKSHGIVCYMNYLTAESFGGQGGNLLGELSSNEMRLSSIVDGIFILRYVEQGASICKLMTVIKLRGSNHTKEIMHYQITKNGIDINSK